MAAGDSGDVIQRLSRFLPKSWFSDAATVRNALLGGIATAESFVYGLIQFAKLQTRLKTATGGWLDLVAADFLGIDARRADGQSDAAFRNEILINLFRERATRSALSRVVTDLTGHEPDIFEPDRPQDTGGYAMPSMGYGIAGRYGSLSLPFQAFVDVQRPQGAGIPLVAGYGIPAGGYSAASQSEYASLDMIEDAVTDAQIFAAIDGVKPAGTIIWVKIGGSPTPDVPPNFSLIVASSPIYFGSSMTPIRLLGWQL